MADAQIAALRAALIDQRRAAIAVVERTERALALAGAPVESAIKTRTERRAERTPPPAPVAVAIDTN
jgi:hypothetical protein